MSIDVQAFRRDLFGLLEEIASGGETFPFSFTELLCMWFDDHWYRPEKHVCDGILSEPEYQILFRFSAIFRAAYPKHGPEIVLDTRKLRGDPKWESVVQAARQAKAEIAALKQSASLH
jgi:hypothetical protein